MQFIEHPIIESIDSVEAIDMTKGEQMLDFIHVDDVASFFVHVIQNIDKYQQLQNGEDFHLGTGRCISVRELAFIVEKVTGKHCNINWGGRPYRERDTMYAAAPIAKNLELTGWHADIKIEQGISNYIRTNFSYE
ncbi:NAD-dependent epimerase/dehydratase family protein [Phocaeicola vulgatus]|uniref:NAD-dependent epimerase/dehydratase family protein n=1 Tax=Phocaeicola vulgatus TaxID=821 RepID=UPI0035617EF1